MSLRPLLSEEQIQKRILDLGAQIDADYPDGTLFLICILKGAIYFLADLSRAADLVKTLSAAWGNPNGASGNPDIRGSGYWKVHASWQRDGVSV